MSRDRILIYFLISSIIISSTILLIEIKMTPKYNTKIYADIYNEYNDIFGINNDIQIVDSNSKNNNSWNRDRMSNYKRNYRGIFKNCTNKVFWTKCKWNTVI